MKKNIQFCFVLLFAFILSFPLEAQETTGVRLKDIGKVMEVRDNQLFGFGLVIGLRNTGDSRNTVFTQQALTNMLKKMGISALDKKLFSSRNVASVMVTATLPPYVRKGQKISVTASAVGDATSLSGGTLILTPLQGPDYKTYAVAQGPLVVGGMASESGKSTLVKNQPTVGTVPNGAIVEVEVPVTRQDQQNVTVVLNESSFVTASRTAKALEAQGFKGAEAVDGVTIRIPLDSVQELPFVEVLAKIENTVVTPDATAKVVINSKTGTIVIGQMVRLFPVAITQGGVSVKIGSASGDEKSAVQFRSTPPSFGGEADDKVEVHEIPAKLLYLDPEPTLSSLVDALNEIGVTPKDLISIIEALKESGALVAQIEVI